MTEDLKQRLIDVKILIGMKQRFNPIEQRIIYDLYNEITGENKVPNGCGACLQNTLSRLKKEMRNAGI